MTERTLSPRDILPVRAAVGNTFAALRKKDFIARANFSCCMGCAVHELTEMAHIRKKDHAGG